MIFTNDNKIKDSIVKKLNIREDQHLDDPTKPMEKHQKTAWDKVYTPINIEFTKKYPGIVSHELIKWKYQRYVQDYFGTIAAVNGNVCRLLYYLDKNSLTDNIIAVYTSDQGFYLNEHSCFDKWFIYNESFKTLLLTRWPNQIKSCITEEEMVQNLDFAQTFLEIAGVQAPDDMQEKSLTPLLKGQKESWDRDAVYYHYYEYLSSKHDVKRHYGTIKNYKFIYFCYNIDECELYGRKKDPQEVLNAFNDPKYSDVVERNETKIKRDMQEV